MAYFLTAAPQNPLQEQQKMWRGQYLSKQRTKDDLESEVKTTGEDTFKNVL